MSASEEPPASAPKRQRMPAPLRHELEGAVDAHLKQYGSRGYDAVRDDPRFAQWTGTDLGYRGEKYFDRVVAAVKAAQARKARAKQRRQSETAAPTEPPSEMGAIPDRPPRRDELGFPDLLGDLRKQRRVVSVEQDACLDDDGAIDQDKRFYRAARELRDIDKAIADLSKQYAALKSGEVADELFRLFGEEFRDQPERVAVVIERFSNLVRHQSGLAARSGADR